MTMQLATIDFARLEAALAARGWQCTIESTLDGDVWQLRATFPPPYSILPKLAIWHTMIVSFDADRRQIDCTIRSVLKDGETERECLGGAEILGEPFRSAILAVYEHSRSASANG